MLDDDTDADGDTLTLTLPGVTRDGGDLASTGTDLTVTVAGAGAAGWTMAWDAGAAALANHPTGDV